MNITNIFRSFYEKKKETEGELGRDQRRDLEDHDHDHDGDPGRVLDREGKVRRPHPGARLRLDRVPAPAPKHTTNQKTLPTVLYGDGLGVDPGDLQVGLVRGELDRGHENHEAGPVLGPNRADPVRGPNRVDLGGGRNLEVDRVDDQEVDLDRGNVTIEPRREKGHTVMHRNVHGVNHPRRNVLGAKRRIKNQGRRAIVRSIARNLFLQVGCG